MVWITLGALVAKEVALIVGVTLAPGESVLIGINSLSVLCSGIIDPDPNSSSSACVPHKLLLMNIKCYYSPQNGSVPFQLLLRPQALSDDPPTSWYPAEHLYVAMVPTYR